MAVVRSYKVQVLVDNIGMNNSTAFVVGDNPASAHFLYNLFSKYFWKAEHTHTQNMLAYATGSLFLLKSFWSVQHFMFTVNLLLERLNNNNIFLLIWLILKLPKQLLITGHSHRANLSAFPLNIKKHFSETLPLLRTIYTCSCRLFLEEVNLDSR